MVDITFELEMSERVNYVMQMNKWPTIRRLLIRNNGETLRNAKLRIGCSAENLTHPLDVVVDALPEGQTLEIEKAKTLLFNGERLANTVDELTTELVLTIEKDGEVIASHVKQITVEPYNYCKMLSQHPEFSASFVTPNHPLICKLAKKTSEIAASKGASSLRTGYDSVQGEIPASMQSQEETEETVQGDMKNVVTYIQAAFEAISEQKIGYSYAPVSHTDLYGQRIRLVHELMAEDAEAGNCIEMSCLLASVLEALHLHPFLVLVPGHCFAGCWYVKKTFAHPVISDVNELRKRLPADLGNGSPSNGELIVVECTQMNHGNNNTFKGACRCAMKELDQFECVVDVVAARRAGVPPLPLYVDEKTGTFRVQELKTADGVSNEVPEMEQVTPDAGMPTVYTKQEQWERRLLGVDLRNGLINAGFAKKSTIPLYCSNMVQLTESLLTGEPFEVLTKKEDETPPKDFEELSRYNGEQKSDLLQFRLRAPIPEEDIQKRCKALQKAAKTALEERGSHTLYLTLGLMRWYESPAKKETPRYAPLLLLPVELISSGHGFKLKICDADLKLNATLMELMKQKFKIQLPAWDSVPIQEDGSPDIPKVMASMRTAAMEYSRWDVVKSVTISNYDYADFAMWKDIHENPEVLQNHPLVNSMIEGRVIFETNDTYFEQSVPKNDHVLPIQTDGSQQFAVEAAVDGCTFVLHGPAGSGKSTCITATIAEKMGNGEKVCLTAEKQAAIDVPRTRLEDMSLGDFVLELHSTGNTDKGRVLQQIDRILELAEQPPEENDQYEIKNTKLTFVKDDLDSYAKALHTVQPCGMSLYELTSIYEKLDKGGSDSFWLDPDQMPNPESVTAQDLNRQHELLCSMATMTKSVGNPAKHALRQVTSTEYSQVYKQKMHTTVIGYRQALERIAKAAADFAKACQLPVADTYTEMESFADLAKQMTQWSSFPKNWGCDAALDHTTQPLRELAAQHTKAADLRAQLLSSWKESFLEADSQQLINEYNTAASSPSLVGRFLLAKLSRKLERLQEQTVMPETLGKHLLLLRHYQNCMEKAEQLQKQCSALLQASFGEAPYDWQSISRMIEQAELSDARIRLLTNGVNGNFRARFAGNDLCVESAVEMNETWQHVTAMREQLYQTLGLKTVPAGPDWIGTELRRCQAMDAQIDMLKDWTAFNRLCQELNDNGLQCVVEAYRAGVEPERVNAAYMRTMYRGMIADIIDRNPTLSHFSGMLFNEQIQRMRELDKEMIQLARKNIYNQVLNNIRQVVAAAKKEDNQLSSLKKVIRSKGRGQTLRQIFQQHLPLIRQLCPCMMFSPASMAQYLPMDNDLFDLVIFDEASQIPTARAVGALARGRNAMIVGDTNQMPPTTFFTANMVDEDNLETEDLESVLDDCLALNIPSAYLKWHYRSRHESLIAFSNNRFYDNKLLTFPSATDRNSHVGLHIVNDGIYEGGSSRCNPKEAEAVIAYLKQHSKGADSHMSVGVITFNAEQQRLVEDLLQQACREDQVLAAWRDKLEEPMFIKNLENVQGDERDVILLSVNYGPDKNGKLSLNFGPLNKEGGWRRLNVAISRAREKMEVFTSMRPEQIDLNRSGARGVSELRAFLEYAGGRQLPVDRGTLKLLDVPAGVTERLCASLQQSGYETVRNVGCSDLRVDVAVVNPQHPEQYIMGILLDGGNYAAAKTTRDRELSQEDVLRGLGWNVRRLWTLDWYDNRDKELHRILEELNRLSAQTG